jgi:hypothetical protein
MNTLTKDVVVKTLDMIDTRILSVTFLKADGTLRTYSGRINVTKGVKGNAAGQLVSKAFAEKGIVPLKTSSGEYKSFKLDRVAKIVSGNTVVEA